MLPGEARKVEELMGAMALLEQEMAVFYESCAEILGEDEALWRDLAAAERLHAQFLQEMKALLKSDPSHFQVGRPMNPVAVRTVIQGVRDNLKKLKNRELTQKKALFLARDLERSILESQYAAIVKTNHPEYQKALHKILTDTRSHQESLEQQIRGRP